jgi:hypothetical protein
MTPHNSSAARLNAGSALVLVALIRVHSTIDYQWVDAAVLLASLRTARHVMRGCLVAFGAAFFAGVVLAIVRKDGSIVPSTMLTMLTVLPAGFWLTRAARFLRQLASAGVPLPDTWGR